MQVMVSLALLVQVVDAIFLVLYVFKLFPKYLNSSVLLGSAAVMLFACKLKKSMNLSVCRT